MHDIVVAGAGRGRSRVDSEPGQRGNEVGGCLESWLLALPCLAQGYLMYSPLFCSLRSPRSSCQRETKTLLYLPNGK